jgi:hypothetical protein
VAERPGGERSDLVLLPKPYVRECAIPVVKLQLKSFFALPDAKKCLLSQFPGRGGTSSFFLQGGKRYPPLLRVERFVHSDAKALKEFGGRLVTATEDAMIDVTIACQREDGECLVEGVDNPIFRNLCLCVVCHAHRAAAVTRHSPCRRPKRECQVCRRDEQPAATFSLVRNNARAPRGPPTGMTLCRHAVLASSVWWSRPACAAQVAAAGVEQQVTVARTPVERERPHVQPQRDRPAPRLVATSAGERRERFVRATGSTGETECR